MLDKTTRYNGHTPYTLAALNCEFGAEARRRRRAHQTPPHRATVGVPVFPFRPLSPASTSGAEPETLTAAAQTPPACASARSCLLATMTSVLPTDTAPGSARNYPADGTRRSWA